MTMVQIGIMTVGMLRRRVFVKMSVRAPYNHVAIMRMIMMPVGVIMKVHMGHGAVKM
jgi:hypothetical protein